MKREDSLADLHARMRGCRRCLDGGYSIVPGAVFSGRSDSQVMLIGQAPGITEGQVKRPFNAGSGRRLFQWLGEAGWQEADFRARHYMTAVTKCYPGPSGNGKGDRVPSKEEQVWCRPFLQQEVTLVNPRLILLVGGLAIKLLFPARAKLEEVIGTAVYFPPAVMTHPVNFNLADGQWLHTPGSVLQTVTERENGRFILPLPHPSGASLWPNKPENKTRITRAIHLLSHIRHTWQL